MSLEVGIKTKLNATLAIRQRADLFEANITFIGVMTNVEVGNVLSPNVYQKPIS